MLCINSSEISGLTGYNKYIKSDKYVEIFIKNLYKHREDLKENDENSGDMVFMTESEKTKLLLSDLTESDKVKINDIIKSDIKDNKELHNSSNKIQKIINNSDVVSEQKDKIIREMDSKINCNYGVNTESKAIKMYETKTNNKVYENNSKCYTKYFDNFLICGKIDGLIEKSGKLYINEIKNRKNRIFNLIPIYEKIQLISYTKLLENTNIIFTQCKDDEQETIILENYIDEKLWKIILNRLNDYVFCIYNLRNDNKLRKKFLSLTEKEQYYYIKDNLKWLK